MKKRILGNSNIEISALGLGCMGMSEFYGPADDEQSLNTLEHAFDIGITLYDSADTYGVGHNEELLGRFAQGKRDKIVLATKCGIVRQKGKYERRIDSSPDYIKSACEASLKRLGTDFIDLFYLHRLNPEVQIEESVGALADLMAEGKITSYGLCEVSEKTLRRAHTVLPVAALQTEYSLWSREPENLILDVCREQNTAFVAYSPLGRGFLTGKLTSKNDLAEGDFRASNPRFQDENLSHNVTLLNAVEEIANIHDCTTGQVALAWLLSQGPDIIPIPGTRRIKYLDENAGSVNVNLSPSDLATLDKVFNKEAISGNRYTDEGMKGINA
ncbi:aldo/keto reductase [Sneathiella sp. HT1-7]|uniref:aldo/keto reductase n=1 Tax=Sneathiella sp. HT1-7 TaxID=2887192 RepID=UPI001D13B46B|nr:aldo/keto reductase [Sneathiella sp. HT1-7]MCC3306198.1 aldo/keto reductase [Sneathiella sp. HT1-7]